MSVVMTYLKRFHYPKDLFLKNLLNCFPIVVWNITPYQLVLVNLKTLYLIKSLKMFWYLLRIAAIIEFLSIPSIVQNILIIQFWYKKKVLAQVYSKQIYTFGINNLNYIQIFSNNTFILFIYISRCLIVIVSIVYIIFIIFS